MHIYWRLKSVPELKGLTANQRNEVYRLVQKRIRPTFIAWLTVYVLLISVIPSVVQIRTYIYRVPSPLHVGLKLFVISMIWWAILLPLAIAKARPHMKKLLEGCCPVCEYDLRGSSDRCPECGTKIAKTWINGMIKSKSASIPPE